MITEILNAENLIKGILKDYPDTRSDDKELILRAWEAQGLVLSPEQEETFKKCISTETIRRTRQKIQEEGQYRPEDKVFQKRQKLEQETRQFFREQKEVLKPIDYDFIGDKAVPIYQR